MGATPPGSGGGTDMIAPGYGANIAYAGESDGTITALPIADSVMNATILDAGSIGQQPAVLDTPDTAAGYEVPAADSSGALVAAPGVSAAVPRIFTIPTQENVWEVVTAWFEEHNIPIIGNVPLFAPGGKMTWALMNLALSATGVLFAVMIAARALSQRKNSKPAANQAGRQLGLILTVAAGIIGIAGLMSFPFIQDMSAMMVFLDMWSILYAAILAVQVGVIAILLRHDTAARLAVEPQE